MARKVSLACGIVASLLYIVMNVSIPLQWQGYSFASRMISELSAIDAPTRSLWVPLGFIYTTLMLAFGWGVWVSARGNRPLRIAGALIFIYSVIGLAWPPMHQREVVAAGGATLTDTLHIVWSAAWVTFMLAAIAFAAAGLGKRFRLPPRGSPLCSRQSRSRRLASANGSGSTRSRRSRSCSRSAC